MPRGKSNDEMAALRIKAAATKDQIRSEKQLIQTATNNLTVTAAQTRRTKSEFGSGTDSIFQRAMSTFGDIELDPQETSASSASVVATSTFDGKAFTRSTIDAHAAQVRLSSRTFLRTKLRVVATALCLAKALPNVTGATFEKLKRRLVPTARRHYECEVAMYDESPMENARRHAGFNIVI